MVVVRSFYNTQKQHRKILVADMYVFNETEN